MNQAAAEKLSEVAFPPVAAQEEESPSSSVSQKRDQEIEQTRQELLQKLRAYTPVKDVTNLPADRLNDRYGIHTGQPLPAFSYGNVRAYAATDDKNADAVLYAAVCDPAHPYRYRALQMLETFEHPHLVRVVDHGVANISVLGEYRYVIIFEKPEGRPLSAILGEGRHYDERSFTERILKPVAAVISAFEEMGINHCRIVPENIFVGEKVILGECISEPAGFSKNFFYEPIERLLAMPQGVGGGTIKTDIYGIGILSVEALFSFDRVRETSKEIYAGHILNLGTYHTLTQGKSFSDGFADLLIGTLNDNYEERWSCSQLNVWLGGKHFNLLKPTPPRDASRPFEFDGESFFSPRALAHCLFSKWEVARNSVRGAKIDRWIEQALHKREMAEMARRILSGSGGHDPANPGKGNEVLARLIAVLDPPGPIRLEHISFSLSGLGQLIADATRGKKQQELTLIRSIVMSDLLSFWTEIQAAAPSEEAGNMLWQIQKSRRFLMNKSMGFGMERIMYDLNPHLSCMSADMVRYHVSSLPDMLYALDAVAAGKAAADTGFADRHLAAFLASHAAIVKEVGIRDMQHHMSLLQNPEITVMMILSMAQEKTGIKQLRGLSYWAAIRMLHLVKNVHSARTRKTVCRDIAAVAEQGHVGYVLQALLNMQVLNGDAAGFEKARQTFQANRARINELQNPKKTRKKAADKAYAIASVASLLALCGAVYSAAKEYFFLFL